MTDHTNTTDPAFTDYRELATTDPDKALDLLVWLFMDAEVAAERYAFLAAMESLAKELHLPSPADFERELSAIREHGVFHAVKNGGIELMRLCTMASVPDLLIAGYEAFTGEAASWILQQEVKRPAELRFGDWLIVSRALAGGSKVADARPQLQNGDPFGLSPDRRSVLICCSDQQLAKPQHSAPAVEPRPFRIVVATCDQPNGTRITKPVVILLNSATGQFEGSISVAQLRGGVGTEFQKDDRLKVLTVNSTADVVKSGLTIDDIQDLMKNDPVAKNSPMVKEALKEWIAEMNSDKKPRIGDSE